MWKETCIPTEVGEQGWDWWIGLNSQTTIPMETCLEQGSIELAHGGLNCCRAAQLFRLSASVEKVQRCRQENHLRKCGEVTRLKSVSLSPSGIRYSWDRCNHLRVTSTESAKVPTVWGVLNPYTVTTHREIHSV